MRGKNEGNCISCFESHLFDWITEGRRKIRSGFGLGSVSPGLYSSLFLSPCFFFLFSTRSFCCGWTRLKAKGNWKILERRGGAPSRPAWERVEEAAARRQSCLLPSATHRARNGMQMISSFSGFFAFLPDRPVAWKIHLLQAGQGHILQRPPPHVEQRGVEGASPPEQTFRPGRSGTHPRGVSQPDRPTQFPPLLILFIAV